MLMLKYRRFNVQCAGQSYHHRLFSLEHTEEQQESIPYVHIQWCQSHEHQPRTGSILHPSSAAQRWPLAFEHSCPCVMDCCKTTLQYASFPRETSLPYRESFCPIIPIVSSQFNLFCSWTSSSPMPGHFLVANY